ncbi:hypothetical protein SUGI_0575620 [Cryptomeria japonica]|uniref:probable RNA helicase SDE3 isoform X2 n=1 Tax=Cryptomeria japonica TaxID=3369 RepID=UPI002408C6A0|nr:probable RNA helicase SDE3 isoform X2 [Cryptomeria japonica]GLJ29187.1 hypothetical protein SUGI_0575620 [Cryptomeria japonica]
MHRRDKIDNRKSNMDPQNHSGTCMEGKIHSKVRGTTGARKLGKTLSDSGGSSTDLDEVIVWCGNKDLTEGVPSTSGCSGSLDGWIDVKYPIGEVNDWVSPSYANEGELQSLSEAETGSNQQIQRVPKRRQRKKDKAPDKNEQRVGGDKGIVGGALNREEVRQTGVSNKNQQIQSGNSGASTAKSGKKHDKEKPKVQEPLHGSQQRDGKEIQASRKGNTKLPCGSLSDIQFVSLSSNHSSEKAKESSHSKTVVSDVPAKSRVMSKQQLEIGNLTSVVEDASCKGKIKMQWRSKISPQAVGNISNSVDTCPKSEGPHPKRIPASKGMTESPNHGKESFGNAKAIRSEVIARHGILEIGSGVEWEVDLKDAKFEERESEEVGEGGISVSDTFCPDLNVKVKDSLPPKYVPLKQLQNLQESETSKGCGTKSSVSEQHAHVVCNKPQRNKEQASGKNEQREVGDKKISNVALENEMRQMGSSGIEDGAPDKNKQRQSGDLGISTGQEGISNQKYEALGINGKASVKGPLLGSVEIGSENLEFHGVNKELEDSKQWGKNERGELLLKESSALKGTTGRPNQGGESIEDAKNVGDEGNGRHGFLGSGNNVEGGVSLNHMENQDAAFSEKKEGGIHISYPFSLENGRPESFKKGGRKISAITVTNKGENSLKLYAVELDKVRPKNSFSLSHSAEPVKSIQAENKSCLYSMGSLEVKMKSMNISESDAQSTSLVRGPWLIEPNHHLIIHLSCTAKDIGLHRSSILFDFQDQKIVLRATLLAEDDVSEQLGPQEPYSKREKRKSSSLRRIVDGVPPALPRFGKKLKSYPIPLHLKNIDDKKLPGVLTDGLSMKTYSKYFSTLLHLEELQMQEDINAYDMDNVTMKSSGEYLVLKVPGLSEKRPSLIYRDQIYVTKSGEKGVAYEGYIHKIEANEIYVKFDKSFHKKFIPRLQYDVHFTFSRISLRRCHQAVEAAGRIDEKFLFPWDSLARKTHNNVSKNDPFNRNLNKEQLSAVHQILNCYGSPPYLVYGPPGTGKTATLIEAILQILNRDSKARILACAPSNAASDILVERLLGSVEKREIFRLNALSRPYQDAPLCILPCCCYRDSMFYCPPVEELLKYKIIVSTYLSAAILDAQEVPHGHFTHIFLDESAQGTEPETMVPIANLANEETTVVLAGDPQQLGPIIRSSMGEKMGLGKSYFERLSELHLYFPDGENKQFVTKLVRNYRSHPAILELPSRLFYGSELVACAGKRIKKLHCAFDELPNKNFPVVFVGIEGIDEREGRSPSWFNTIEISKVLEIVKKVKDDKRNSVTGKDIGVITPYRQQVVKLRKAFGQKNLSDVKVGSVEQFQGDERTVIIISTVRSSYKEEYDMKFNLGFIGNPKRFNVAITRAKSLLVVVGNPYVLSKDIYWNELLEYCISNKSYVGCVLPPKDSGNEFPPGSFPDDVGTSDPISYSFVNQDMEWADATC